VTLLRERRRGLEGAQPRCGRGEDYEGFAAARREFARKAPAKRGWGSSSPKTPEFRANPHHATGWSAQHATVVTACSPSMARNQNRRAPRRARSSDTRSVAPRRSTESDCAFIKPNEGGSSHHSFALNTQTQPYDMKKLVTLQGLSYDGFINDTLIAKRQETRGCQKDDRDVRPSRS
jgi:hypothetical protein